MIDMEDFGPDVPASEDAFAEDLALIRRVLSGTALGTIDPDQFVPAVLTDELVRNGTARLAIDALRGVRSGLGAHRLASLFVSVTARPLAGELLDVFPRIGPATGRWQIGSAIYEMAHPSVAHHVPAASSIVIDPIWARSREMVALALPRFGGPGVRAALELLGRDDHIDVYLFDALNRLRIAIPEHQLQALGAHEVARIRRNATKRLELQRTKPERYRSPALAG